MAHYEVYEKFLAEEAAIHMPDVSVADRGWFHLCVLQCAVAWSRHPKATFRINRGKHHLVLNCEGPVEEKIMTMFSFHSAVARGDYRFTGLTGEKFPAGLSATARGNLTRLRDLYEAALPNSFLDEGVVTVIIRKQSQIDFLPIVDEARRVLDDGNQEFAPIDLTQLSVPTENPALVVTRTNITPAPRPKLKPPPAQLVPAGKHRRSADDDEDGDSDIGSDGRHGPVAMTATPRTGSRKGGVRRAADRASLNGKKPKPAAARTPARMSKKSPGLSRAAPKAAKRVANRETARSGKRASDRGRAPALKKMSKPQRGASAKMGPRKSKPAVQKIRSSGRRERNGEGRNRRARAG